jgi:prepilin-type N-terminal cleavage/methylation domain-containing protein
MLKNRIAAARNRHRTGDQGFTLIELLIVIVVLGVLAGIVVFGVAQFQGDSENAACEASLKTVATAADAYRAANGEAPDDGAAGITQLVTGDYLEEAPDASWEITLTDGEPSSGNDCEG